jgi:DNA repair protein radC
MKELIQVPEIKISFSIPNFKDRPKIRCSEDIRPIVEPYFKDILVHHEEIWAVLINNANAVLGVIQLGVGNDISAVVNTKALYQAMILSNAIGCILVHNHPSGVTKPSGADDLTTEKVKKVLNILECRLLDHLIIGFDSEYSYADEGRL